MIDNVIYWLRKTTEVGICLIALSIVAEILFGVYTPFFPPVIENVVFFVAELGEEGLIGIVAIGIIKINANIKLPAVFDNGAFCPWPKIVYKPQPKEAKSINTIPYKLFSENLGSTKINNPNKANAIPSIRTLVTFSLKNNAPENITNMLPPNNINAPIPVSIVKYAKLKPIR